MGEVIQLWTSVTDNKPMPRELQVSGLRIFPEDRWRDCILHFLSGMWGDDESVTYRPKIDFGGIALRFIPETGEYIAYGTSGELAPAPTSWSPEATLTVASTQSEVELGLVRFVKNDRTLLLIIRLRGGGEVRLWKKRWRSRFGISAQGILPDAASAIEAALRES